MEKGLNELKHTVTIVSLNFNKYNRIQKYFLSKLKLISTLFNYGKNCDILFINRFGIIESTLFILYSKLTRKKLIFELTELPFSVFGGTRKDFYLKYTSKFKRYILIFFIYPFVDAFVVISENLRGFVSKSFRKKLFIEKIPIIVDYEYYQQDIGKELEFVHPNMLHTTVLNNEKEGIISILDAMAILKDKYNFIIHFYLTSKKGIPSLLKEINRKIIVHNLQDVIHFLGDISEDDLLFYQKNCDLIVINKPTNQQNMYNFSSKLGEYLALGKPLIITRVGEVTNYLEEKKNCFFIPENDSNAIAEKILFVLQKPEMVKEIELNNKSLAKNYFDYKINTQKLSKFIYKIYS